MWNPGSHRPCQLILCLTASQRFCYAPARLVFGGRHCLFIMESDAAIGCPMDSRFPCLPPLSFGAFSRYYPRQEPYEVIPHVRIGRGVPGARHSCRDLCFTASADHQEVLLSKVKIRPQQTPDPSKHCYETGACQVKNFDS